VLIAGRERAGKLAAAEPNLGSRGAWSLGAAIAAAEFPTALPYFATLAAIIGSGLSLANQLLLVAVFNVVFILPLLAMIAVLALAGERAAAHLRGAGDWLRGRAPLIFATLALIAGAVLTALGITGLATS
jgi:cytochrome c biogenesis protein CcdA